MRERNRRVVWLLNHKTLMPYEVGLLHDLGFEVFIPKIFPNTEEYRSCVVDRSYDATLTIPPNCLERLNAFNFYEGTWPASIVTLLNRYFGTAIVVAHAQQVPEAIDKFEGRIIFRAFGLAYSKSYVELLQTLYGGELIAKIYRLGERFWFGHGYEQMLECEPPLLARRAVYLPVGLAASAWRNAGRWNGSVGKLLFACRNVINNATYATVYKDFKRDFGDLPHIIVGSQEVPVDDPNVVGYVSDEELQQLYLDCAVLYYHSHAPRHVHYSPIEASINGMPVVFYKDNLLGRVAERPMAGAVSTTPDARALVERILSGDQAVIDQVRRDQQQIAYHFSDDYCRPIWQRAVVASGAFPRPVAEGSGTVWARETARWVLTPLWSGRSAPPLPAHAPLPPYDALQEPLARDAQPGSPSDGIDFREREYPGFVCFVDGMSSWEPWGRWTRGPKVTIVLSRFLEDRFRVVVTGGAYGKNIGAPIKVRIGNVERTLRFATGQSEPRSVTAEFSLPSPSNVIELRVPFPTAPEGDDRAIGLGLVSLRVEAIAAGAA